VSWDKIDALDHWHDSDAFDARERAVLAYAEAVVRTDRQPDDETVARVREHFGEDAFTELTGLIAFQNMSSTFNAALDVPPQGFCKPKWLQPGASPAGEGGDAADSGTTPEAAERSRA
jgi:alkylhydroperoxidase family enzyme